VIQRVLADGVLVAHLGFIVFVVAGGLLALRWRWMPALHLPAAAWGVFVETTGRVCPLTPLENALRRAAGQAGYAGGFVEHYLVPLVYPAALTPRLQGWLAAGVVLANVLVYAWVLASRGRAPRTP
jgi:hypothetical protein